MRCGECSQCRSWDLDQKCEVPDAVQIDKRDSKMLELSYAYRSAQEVFQEMDDGEPQSMSQVLWLISLGLTSEELITIPMVSLMSLRRMKRWR